MLSDFIVTIVNWLNSFLCGLLPETTNISNTLDNASSFITTLIDFIQQVNFVVPLTDLLIVIGIDVSISLGFFAVYVINFIKNVIVNLIP